MSSFFEWVALGSAVVAGVVTLLAPVPGSRVVSAAIWTAIFSSTAAATINIGQRYDEGFSSWKANAFDVLTIVGNVFAGAGIGISAWAKGAQVTVQTERGVLTGLLFGQVATDGVQGVIISVDHIQELEETIADQSLTPHERAQRLVALVASLTADGVLIYLNVKGTKADLDNLHALGTHPDDLAPASRLSQLADESASIDTTTVPSVEGTTSAGTHTTTVQLDPATQTPHAGGRVEPAPRSHTEQLKDAMGHAQYRAHLEKIREIRADHPELAHITDDELIAIRGYTSSDYDQLNPVLRTENGPMLETLGPYIEEATNGLKKLPGYHGIVKRGDDMDPARFDADFRGKTEFSDRAFFSASFGTPFEGSAMITIESRGGGRKIDFLAEIPDEAEVLFPPGTRFKILEAVEVEEGQYEILLKELQPG